MAGFYTETNKKRAQKILDIIDMLHKSSISNKAGVDEMQEMLQPVIFRLTDLGLDMGSQSAAPDQGSKSQPVISKDEEVSDVPSIKSMTTPLWSSVREMAENAPLKELGHAMAIYGSRVDDAVFELEQKSKAVGKTDVTPEEVEEVDPWD